MTGIKRMIRKIFAAKKEVDIEDAVGEIAARMTQLLRSIDMVRSHTNEGLKIDGIVMTLVDGRTNLAKDVINAISVSLSSFLNSSIWSMKGGSS